MMPETPMSPAAKTQTSSDLSNAISTPDRMVLWMFLLGMLMFGIFLLGDLFLGILQ